MRDHRDLSRPEPDLRPVSWTLAAAAFLRWLGTRVLEFIGPVALLIGVVVVGFATGNEVAFVVVLVIGVAAFVALILRELRNWWREQGRRAN